MVSESRPGASVPASSHTACSITPAAGGEFTYRQYTGTYLEIDSAADLEAARSEDLAQARVQVLGDVSPGRDALGVDPQAERTPGREVLSQRLLRRRAQRLPRPEEEQATELRADPARFD